MKKTGVILKDTGITIAIICTCFLLCFLIQELFGDNTLISAFFVLGAFLTSLLTNGYVYGVVFVLASVLTVNFAFTLPYFAFDFTVAENIISAILLLSVAIITCSLTTTIKKQESIKLESEKEKMRANLLRAVSHDLRTPLTTIYGASSVLLDNYETLSDEKRRKMLESIQEDAQWLSRMVENLLSITRLDGANVQLIKTDTLLDELVDSILVKFTKRYPGHEVIVDLPDSCIFIPMDAILIEQVVINLLENAVEHAKGMKRLVLRVFTISNQAVFEVEDDGCGMPEEVLKHIFTKHFYSENVPPDSKKHNSGIGLSVCASIIKAHGGDITAANVPEGGCIFRFTLDMEEAPGEQSI